MVRALPDHHFDRARHGVDVPIVSAIAAILDDALSVEAAIDGLVSRPLKTENT